MDLSKPIAAVIPSLDGDVFMVLAGTTQPLTGERIAGIVGTASGTGVRRVLKRMVRQGLVTAQEAGNANLYQANRQHLLWPAIAALVNAASSALDTAAVAASELLESELGEHASGATLAIFGSAARGEATAASDLDLLLVVDDEIDPQLVERVTDQLRSLLHPMLGNDINTYSVTKTRLRELVTENDPMIESWATDAKTMSGPDVQALIRSLR